MAERNDESPVIEAVSEVRSKWTKWLEALRSFWRTKRAIDAGIPLYEWPAAEVLKAGYFGPWKFNAVETAITGGIAAITANFLNLLAGAKPDKDEILTDLDPVFASLLKTTSGWVDPFTIPILLTGIFYFMGWGTLRSKDSNSETRRRARSAYLYFDGAHGFYSQLFLAFGVSLLTTDIGQKLVNVESLNPFSIGFLVALVIAGIWQSLITARRLPRLMFTANGYSTRRPHFWQRALPNDPPWGKLVLANILGGWPLVMGVLLVLNLLSYSLASLLFWLRSLVV